MKSSVPPTSASPTFTTVTASDLEVDSGTLSVDETNNRVGIGTTSPDGRLHVMKASAGSVTASGDGNALVVENSDVAGMSLLSPNDGVIYFGDVADNDIGRIVYKHSDDSMNLWTNNAVRMTIDNAGNGVLTGALTTTGITMAPANATTAIAIDHDFTSTADSTVVGLDLDLDKTGNSTGTSTLYGIRVDMDSTAGTAGSTTMIGASLTPTCQHVGGGADPGTVMVKGLEVVATGGVPGTETCRALDLSASGADYNQGIYMAIADGGPDLKMVSSADSGDFCTLSVGAAGATTLVTVDDGGAAADLTLSIDGAFSVAATSSSFNNAVTAAGVVLSEASSLNIAAPSLPTTDHTSTGLTAQMLAGGAIAAFETVCIHTVTGEVVITDADAIGTMPVIGIAPAAISDTATGTILLQGFIRDDSWTWTPGGVLYASGTAGAMTQTAPSGTGDFVQAVGVALTASTAYFNPSLTLVEVA